MKKVVVIGSGLAGSLICNEIARNCRVTLLEAGSRDRITYPEVEFLNKDFGVVKTFCIGGGTTNLWHNGRMPLDPGDVDSVQFRDVLNEARPCLDEVATRLFFKNKNYSAEYDAVRSDMMRAVAGASASTDGVDCLLYPKTYHPLRPEPKVEAIYGVADIEFMSKGGGIGSIRYAAGGGQYEINPEMVVVSAGTLGTPGIIQEPSYANTGLTIGALALRLADRVRV